MKLLLLVALAVTGWGADACDPVVAQGPYGFLLSGMTTISGDAKPVADVGRLVLDGSGGVSGFSTAMFAVFLIGNPLTGTYAAKNDCTITWSLQDDSGNFQHFAGKYTPDGARIAFRQSDPTGPQNGTMIKTPASCTLKTVQRQFRYTMAGAGSTAGSIDGAKLVLDDDCFVHFQVGGDNFRGIVVDGGKEVLGMRTDPGAPLTIHLREQATSPGQD